MPRLIWSAQALRDVRRLHRFLVEKNPEAALRAVKSIRAGVRVLADQPGMGRPAEGMETDYREWLIDFGDSGYVVLYHYGGREAVILAVRHQREAGY